MVKDNFTLDLCAFYAVHTFLSDNQQEVMSMPQALYGAAL